MLRLLCCSYSSKFKPHYVSLHSALSATGVLLRLEAAHLSKVILNSSILWKNQVKFFLCDSRMKVVQYSPGPTPPSPCSTFAGPRASRWSTGERKAGCKNTAGGSSYPATPSSSGPGGDDSILLLPAIPGTHIQAYEEQKLMSRPLTLCE